VLQAVDTQISESPDTIAWNKAKMRRSVELALAITAGLVLSAMLAVFYSILTR
jgi:hypothetical protein